MAVKALKTQPPDRSAIMLAASGHVIMGVAETDGRRSIALSRRLRLNGFRTVRTRAFPGFSVVTAQSNGRIA